MNSPSQKPLLKYGNSKLPKSTAIITLPAIKTCPGGTPACRKYCFALKAERLWPNVRPARTRYFKASKCSDFESRIIAELRKSDRKVMRVHESGDFYSQEYVYKWFRIARELPGVTFYAYTRSHKLDFSNAPANFILFASFDDMPPPSFNLAGYSGIAIVTRKKRVRGFRTCPGDCKACNYCYTKPGIFKSVNFIQH